MDVYISTSVNQLRMLSGTKRPGFLEAQTRGVVRTFKVT